MRNIPDHILISKANELDPDNTKQHHIVVVEEIDNELQQRYEEIKEELEHLAGEPDYADFLLIAFMEKSHPK